MPTDIGLWVVGGVAIGLVVWAIQGMRAGKKRVAQYSPPSQPRAVSIPEPEIVLTLRVTFEGFEQEDQQRAALPPGVDPVFEPNRPLPPGMVAVLPPVDPEHNSYKEGQVYGQAVGRTVVIDYCDAAGNRTRRQVTVKQLIDGGDGDADLFCWCHHRRALRTFRLSRVDAMFRPDTGEVIDRPLDFLTGMVQGPEGEAVALYEDDIIVLTYLAKADRRMIKKERDVILDYLFASYHSPEKLDRAVLDAELKLYDPADMIFRSALRALRDVPIEQKERLANSAEAVMRADGKEHDAEKDAIQILRRVLLLDAPQGRQRKRKDAVIAIESDSQQ